MSAVPLKRSLRRRKVINYLDVIRGKKLDTSVLSDQNISAVSDQDASLVSDPNVSFGETLSDGSRDELFSAVKKKKVSDDLMNSSNFRRASITLKRVPLPSNPARAPPPIIDKHFNLAGILAATENDEDEDANEYRLQRQKQKLDREMMLKSIDFHEDVQELRAIAKSSLVAVPVKKITPAKRPWVKRYEVTSRRRSERIQNINLSNHSFERSYYEESDNRRSPRLHRQSAIGQGNVNHNGDTPNGQSSSFDYDAKEDADMIDENLNIMESEEDQEFLSSLKDAINIPYDSVSDFTTCNFDKFKETIKLCHMFEEPAKVITSRIVSMDFHPSEKKLLVLVGDKYGNIALRDLVTYSGVEIKGHQYNVNCLKFSQQNNAKFYSTSLDGTVRIGDINTNSLNLLFTSDVHTTWNHERNNTLYIAEGNGAVRLLDLRSPNDNTPSFQCHKRSVRTVQTHPLDENYFLTSSGTGSFGVWDVRYTKGVEPQSVIMESFTHALTSAFYSAKGRYVLTTGNDDTIRVFEIANNKSTLVSKISHGNHTGRWLSVFKAIWQPQREDCFYVGSMMQPRRMQAYSEKGIPLHEFRSDAMSTVNSVITVHPTKPIIVGGNGSGKIHIFSPFRNLTDI